MSINIGSALNEPIVGLSQNYIPVASTTQWATSYLSSVYGQSSAYQSSVLSNTFLPLVYSTKFNQSWKLEGGNVVGTTGSAGGNILYFSGGNNITLSGNSNTIVFSAGAAAAAPVRITAGITSGDLATIQFNNANGVSFGLTGSTITGSINPPTIETSALTSVFLTTAAQVSHTHSDLYQSKADYLTTAQPVGNYLTTAAQADHTHGGFTGTNITGTYNSTGLQLSVAAPSSPPVRRMIEIIPGEYLTKVITVSATQVSKRVIFNPFWLDGNGLHASTVRIVMSWVTNTTPPSMTYGAGLYSMVNETSYALYDSTTATINPAGSANSLEYSGIRMWDITGMIKTLSEGPWLLGLYFSGTASGAMNGILMGASAWPTAVGYVSGNGGTAGTNNTNQFYQFQGYYSNTTAGFPAGVGQSDISGGRAADAFDFYAIIKEV